MNRSREEMLALAEQARLQMHRDYPLRVDYGLTENGRDYAVRDEHYRDAADNFVTILRTLARENDGG